VNIRSLHPGEHTTCETVLRCLPDWFGIDESLRQYVADAADTSRFESFVADDGGRVLGFVTLRRHFAESGEIHCMGVVPEFHGKGVGRSLVARVESVLRQAGASYLQVKTMGPSRPSEFYARTLAFYRSVGFMPLEEIHGLWGKIPCLVLVKKL
jgi:ribosomal protein S18 acetylase RimI-like enzyme